MVGKGQGMNGKGKGGDATDDKNGKDKKGEGKGGDGRDDKKGKDKKGGDGKDDKKDKDKKGKRQKTKPKRLRQLPRLQSLGSHEEGLLVERNSKSGKRTASLVKRDHRSHPTGPNDHWNAATIGRWRHDGRLHEMDVQCCES